MLELHISELFSSLGISSLFHTMFTENKVIWACRRLIIDFILAHFLFTILIMISLVPPRLRTRLNPRKTIADIRGL